MKIYMGMHMFHVNSMAGYFENQDTSQAKGKNQTLHYSKRQKSMTGIPLILCGQTRRGSKTLYQEVYKTSNITLLCKMTMTSLSKDH